MQYYYDAPFDKLLADVILNSRVVSKPAKINKTIISAPMPNIVDVIYNNPATIVFWDDGTKTVVKCGKHDKYTGEHGLVMAIVKKLYGNNGRYYDIIRKWLPEDER